jgi:hypothetical protein
MGGTELVNNARTAQYAAMYGIPVKGGNCANLAASLSDPPYMDQVSDPAPWYDPSVPDSKGFCGFLGLEIIGASDSTSTTRWTNLIGDGAVSGPLRRDAREIQVKTVAIGANEAALSYGISWLASALRGSPCRVGEELMLYAACPEPPRQPCTAEEEPPTYGPVALGDHMVRRLFNVMVLQGPKVTLKKYLSAGRSADSGSVLAEVNFIVKAGVPFWYQQPMPVASALGGQGRPPTEYFADTLVNYDPDSYWTTCRTKQETVDQSCLDDQAMPLPGCKDTAPPIVPVPPQDPCYPSGPYPKANRIIYKIERADLTDWLEKVPILTLQTGATPLRRLLVRWYTNPQGRPPTDALDPCAVCSSFTIAYLPRNSTLTIDGRVNSAVVECTGNRIANPILYGPASSLYSWPIFECNTSMFLEVIVDSRSSWAPDSTLDVFLCARGDTC